MVLRVTHRRSDPMAETSRPRRVLVISNETVEADILHETLVAHADATEVVVVAPALNTRIRHWLSDEDPARHAAQRRADALVVFDADELLIATHPEARSNWLAHDLVGRACGRFSLPVVHLVVEDARARGRVLLAA